LAASKRVKKYGWKQSTAEGLTKYLGDGQELEQRTKEKLYKLAEELCDNSERWPEARSRFYHGFLPDV
jgi:hypothetical protein